MAKNLATKTATQDMFNSLKKKLVEFGIDYVKQNFKFKKEDVAKYVEKHIQKTLEIKVKKEIRKQTFKFSTYILLGFGSIMIIYFLLDLVVLLLEVPPILTNLLFGLFLILCGIMLYILR